MKAKIRLGALVGQDRSYWIWGKRKEDKVATIFVCEPQEHDPERVCCHADGYGNLEEPDKYGNGRIYCRLADLIITSDVSDDKCAREVPPPVGLCPKWLRDEQRGQEILGAMLRYNNDRRRIPNEWIEEFIKINEDRRQ